MAVRSSKLTFAVFASPSVRPENIAQSAMRNGSPWGEAHSPGLAPLLLTEQALVPGRHPLLRTHLGKVIAKQPRESPARHGSLSSLLWKLPAGVQEGPHPEAGLSSFRGSVFPGSLPPGSREQGKHRMLGFLVSICPLAEKELPKGFPICV